MRLLVNHARPELRHQLLLPSRAVREVLGQRAVDLLANEPRLLRAALDGRELTDDAEHVAAGLQLDVVAAEVDDERLTGLIVGVVLAAVGGGPGRAACGPAAAASPAAVKRERTAEARQKERQRGVGGGGGGAEW